jgi:hypothetical protein
MVVSLALAWLVTGQCKKAACIISIPYMNKRLKAFSEHMPKIKDLVTPNISACRKIDSTLLIKALFISWKKSN